MIGIIVATHGRYGEEIIKSAEFILGNIPWIEACSLQREQKADQFISLMNQMVKEMEELNGVIIFSDLYGGTPSNLSMLENKHSKVRTISGLNMAMLITCVMERQTMELDELANMVVKEGKEGIKLTSDLLKEERA